MNLNNSAWYFVCSLIDNLNRGTDKFRAKWIAVLVVEFDKNGWLDELNEAIKTRKMDGE